MKRHALAARAAILALMAVLAACTDNLTEPGESGTRWNRGETATDSRRGFDLTISYNATNQRFDGSVTLDASGQNFTWYSVHVELGSSSS